jgi:hypothetical protein
LLAAAAGCSHRGGLVPEVLAERILPPPGTPEALPPLESEGPRAEKKTEAGENKSGPGEKKEGQEEKKEGAKETEQAAGSANELPKPRPVDPPPGKSLSLPEAIAWSFELQPRLKASLESIAQAQGREDIAFAAFLPVLNSGYSTGGFDLNAGGFNALIGTAAAFTFIPALGSVPVGLDVRTGYNPGR